MTALEIRFVGGLQKVGEVMEEDYEFLLAAFDEAEKARIEGTFPIGAVIVNSEGEIVRRKQVEHDIPI